VKMKVASLTLEQRQHQFFVKTNLANI